MLWFLMMLFILFLTSVVDLMVRLLQAGYGDFFTMVFGDKIMALEFAFVVIMVLLAVCMLIESVLPPSRRRTRTDSFT